MLNFQLHLLWVKDSIFCFYIHFYRQIINNQCFHIKHNLINSLIWIHMVVFHQMVQVDIHLLNQWHLLLLLCILHKIHIVNHRHHRDYIHDLIEWFFFRKFIYCTEWIFMSKRMKCPRIYCTYIRHNKISMNTCDINFIYHHHCFFSRYESFDILLYLAVYILLIIFAKK